MTFLERRGDLFEHRLLPNVVKSQVTTRTHDDDRTPQQLRFCDTLSRCTFAFFNFDLLLVVKLSSIVFAAFCLSAATNCACLSARNLCGFDKVAPEIVYLTEQKHRTAYFPH